MKSYTNGELAIMDESELYKHYHKIRSILSKSRKSNKTLESYYCYVSREIRLRQQRRAYGKKYEERKRNGK